METADTDLADAATEREGRIGAAMRGRRGAVSGQAETEGIEEEVRLAAATEQATRDRMDAAAISGDPPANLAAEKDIVVEHPAPPLNMGNTGLTSSRPFGLDSDDLCQHNNPKLTCMQCHSFVNLSKLGDYDADSLAQAASVMMGKATAVNGPTLNQRGASTVSQEEEQQSAEAKSAFQWQKLRANRTKVIKFISEEDTQEQAAVLQELVDEYRAHQIAADRKVSVPFDATQKRYICPVCRDPFVKEANLMSHVELIHLQRASNRATRIRERRFGFENRSKKISARIEQVYKLITMTTEPMDTLKQFPLFTPTVSGTSTRLNSPMRSPRNAIPRGDSRRGEKSSKLAIPVGALNPGRTIADDPLANEEFMQRLEELRPARSPMRTHSRGELNSPAGSPFGRTVSFHRTASSQRGNDGKLEMAFADVIGSPRLVGRPGRSGSQSPRAMPSEARSARDQGIARVDSAMSSQSGVTGITGVSRTGSATGGFSRTGSGRSRLRQYDSTVAMDDWSQVMRSNSKSPSESIRSPDRRVVIHGRSASVESRWDEEDEDGLDIIHPSGARARQTPHWRTFLPPPINAAEGSSERRLQLRMTSENISRPAYVPLPTKAPELFADTVAKYVPQKRDAVWPWQQSTQAEIRDEIERSVQPLLKEEAEKFSLDMDLHNYNRTLPWLDAPVPDDAQSSPPESARESPLPDDQRGKIAPVRANLSEFWRRPGTNASMRVVSRGESRGDLSSRASGASCNSSWPGSKEAKIVGWGPSCGSCAHVDTPSKTPRRDRHAHALKFYRDHVVDKRKEAAQMPYKS